MHQGDDMVTSPSNQSMMQRNHSANELPTHHNGNGTFVTAVDQHKANTHFMKKIPPGAEASNILVGEVEFLDKTLSAFVRLNEAAIMGDLTEVPVPTRYVSILFSSLSIALNDRASIKFTFQVSLYTAWSTGESHQLP